MNGQYEMVYDAETLTKRIESGFAIGASTDHALSVTGEPYFVIGEQAGNPPIIPGTIDDGREREMPYDEETAYFSALASFNQYAECCRRLGAVCTLYWRVKPQLEWTKDRRRCMFYMRLLLSDKPPLASQGG